MSTDIEHIISEYNLYAQRSCFEQDMAEHDAKVRADAIDELADYVLNQFAPLFTKEELIKQFKEQLKEQSK